MKLRIMIEGFDLSRELEKYTSAKIGQLSKQLPRKLRPTAACRVDFSLVTNPGVKAHTCRLTFTVDGTELTAQETTQHMYAALDIAAVHIEQQLHDHLARQQGQHRFTGRLKHGIQADWQ